MEYSDFLYNETINCIPSSYLRKHLHLNHINLSILQKATIISYFSKSTTVTTLFKQLTSILPEGKEKDLLSVAISEISITGHTGDKTQKVFEDCFYNQHPPFFPFLEVCHLPILFSKNDIIIYRGEHYRIISLPLINENCDFSDENYLCYPLKGDGHFHIHIGESEPATTTLNELDKKGNVLEAIHHIASSTQDIYSCAYSLYSNSVNEMIKNIPEQMQVEQLLDGLLDFCDDDSFSLLYKKLCNYAIQYYPDTIKDYLSFYESLFKSSRMCLEDMTLSEIGYAASKYAQQHPFKGKAKII